MTSARLIALVVFGAAALNYPILHVFAVDGWLFGLPVLYVYLYSTWLLLIIGTGLALRSRRERILRQPDAASGDNGA